MNDGIVLPIVIYSSCPLDIETMKILYFLITLLPPLTRAKTTNLTTILQWLDKVLPTGPDTDIFFDRIVALWLDMPNPSTTAYVTDHLNVGIGVLITETLVLTSFNPLRGFTKDKKMKNKMQVTYLAYRNVKDLSSVNYVMETISIACARQVIPITDNELTSNDQWHGTNKVHSPVHDLMVMRLSEELKFLDPNPKLYSFSLYPKKGKASRQAGPLKTEIAKPGQLMGRDFKFVSHGHVSDQHINSGLFLHKATYEFDDNAVVDCNRWFPIEWGHFICVRNTQNYEALGSGGTLFYNDTLYGLGCFALRKGKKEGILVFTDVRPYHDLLFKTCTNTDQI